MRKGRIEKLNPWGISGCPALGDLELESGERLSETWVAWQASDSSCFTGRRTVLLLHALTDAHEFWAIDPPLDLFRGWGNRLVGGRRAIDTDRFSVVCLNMLGSCFGSTGPQSTCPGTEERYGYRFPTISLGDQRTFIARAIQVLGLRSIHAVVGCTYGGCVAIALSLLNCAPVGRVAVLGGPRRGFSDRALIDQLRRIAVSGNRERFIQWRRRILSSYSTFNNEHEVNHAAEIWAKAQDPVSMRRLFDGLAYSDIAEQVEQLRLPLFVICTRDDPYFPVASRRARDWKFPEHTRYHTLPGREHHAALRYTASFAQKLQWFLTA